MAKGKFEYWLTNEGLLLLEGWARDGLTEAQMSANMGIRRETLIQWKKRFPNISNTLKKGKEVTDRIVENALLKKTTGYNAEIKKTFKVKVVDYDPDTGRKIREREELQEGVDEVHVPADTTAQIYWLKNRMPKNWRDKPVSLESSMEEVKEGLKELMDIVNAPLPARRFEDE